MANNMNGAERPNVKNVLDGLKDFQRETVDYAYRRLYEDPDATSRFLIADEVGLGKTLVARGLIARAVDCLWDTTDRIDVIYICSNQEIAQQNIDRLNVTQQRQFQLASRATLLPITLSQLRGNKLNFVSLTPGTSFNLRSSTGWVYERVLLYYLIRKEWNISEAALSNVLRADVKRENWAWEMEAFQRNKIDQDLEIQFLAELSRNPDLSKQFEALVREIGSRRKHTPDELRWERNRLIGEFRELLARSSLAALEPDLVILDEFQRFRDLLDANNPLSSLAQTLFTYPRVKVLLLSATPYKMYTLSGEDGEDHYTDFQRTACFLLENFPGRANQLEEAIGRYRKAMMRVTFPESRVELRSARTEVESILRKVMVRTERLAATDNRNGMLSESRFAQDTVRSSDLQAFLYLDHIANIVNAGDQVEYWKSSAYPLNLMEGYHLKRLLRKALEAQNNTDLRKWLKKASGSLLHWEDIRSYEPVDAGNARVRALVSDTLDTNNFRLLWMPPAMPYYQPAGPFATVRPDGQTKTLIFSSWQVAPKTIAMLLSYEAERRIIGNKRSEIAYDQLTEKRRPLLRFALNQQQQIANLSNFCLLYPSLTIASRIDPLEITGQLIQKGQLPALLDITQVVETVISKLLDQACESLKVDPNRLPDETWYWAAPLLIDRFFENQALENWLFTPNEELYWDKMLSKETDSVDGGPNRFSDHVNALRVFFRAPGILGPRPKDLISILARMALASPAICTLRAMLRRTPDADPAYSMASAAQGGLGFRTLFNQPEAILLLQDLYPELDYWKAVVQYGLEGNLQSVLDEYIHILYESLGLVGHTSNESVTKMGDKVREVLSIRAPLLRFDEFVLQDGQQIKLEDRRIRCRYALRIGEDTAEELEGRTRASDVRDAFNSPFRPFILASTSIGQEGLDFHLYCHRIVHWNLPSNPVDLEQREGRIHRYKGHVIRRNLSENLASWILGNSPQRLTDPWQDLFEEAVRQRKTGENDIIPYWIYEGGKQKIERRLPILPLSRESYQIDGLKRALVVYRSLIGQPRQQELMDFLKNLPDQDINEVLNDCSINLKPDLRSQISDLLNQP